MTVVLAILKAIWPYLVIAGFGAFGAWYVTHKLDTASLDALQAKYSQYVAQVAQAEETAQKAATDALARQLQQQKTTEDNNAAIIAKLEADKTAAESDRDIAVRLFNGAKAANDPGSGSMSKAVNQPPASASSGASGGGSLTTDLAAAIGECRRNAARLNALIAEISPQL